MTEALENIKKLLIDWLQEDGYDLEESVEAINASKIRINDDVISIVYDNGVKDIVKIKDGVVSTFDENQWFKNETDTTKFRKLTNQELVEFSKQSKHPGMQEYLREMGEDGLEGYDGKFLIHEGDFETTGSFDFNGIDGEDITVLIIKGDMRVPKLFRDYCHDGPSCTLILGDLYAKNAIIAGFIELKNMHVREAIIGDYNDGGALIDGDLNCSLFMPFDLPFEVQGDINATERGPGKEPLKSLSDIYFEDGEVDESKIISDLIVGKSITK